MGLRCIRNGASESLVNMQGPTSCTHVLSRLDDFILFLNRLYYVLGCSWGSHRLSEGPSFHPGSSRPLRRPLLGALGGSCASGRTPRSLRDPYSLSFCPLPLLDSQNLLHILCIPSSAAASAKRSEIRRAVHSHRVARHGVWNQGHNSRKLKQLLALKTTRYKTRRL